MEKDANHPPMNKKIDGGMRRTGFFLIYIFIYAANGVLMPYYSLLFSYAGFQERAIGILSSIGPLMSLICQPIWGIISDRAKSKRRVLRLTLIVAAIVIWMLSISYEFWIMVGVLVLFFAFQSALLPLTDTITLESLEGTGFKFAPIRLAGSVGYALASALAGKILGVNILYVFSLYSFANILALLATFKIPDVAGHQGGRKRIFIRELFKDRELIRIYIFALLLHTTSGYNYTFLSVYLKELGVDMKIVGLGYLISALSEFPFLSFADLLLDRLGIGKLFLISGIFHALRWFLCFSVMGPGTILFIQALHGMTYIVLYYSLARFVNQRVRKELKATGQMMNWVVLNGLGKIFGSTAGGFIAGAVGIRYGYLLAGILAFVVTLVYAPIILREYKGVGVEK